MKRRSILLACLVAAAVAAALPGCAKPRPGGAPADWLDEARRLEEQGAYFQEKRENAPLGALEYYRHYLEVRGDKAPDRRDVQERIDWLEALKLAIEDDFQGKANYPGAIRAMTAFRDRYPDSVNYAMALFYRALAKEYDLDHPDIAGAVDDYRRFIAENPDHDLVPEVYIRIAHCYSFDLDAPDYAKAVEACDELIRRFGPTDDAVARAPVMTRLAVERALYNKASILDNYVAPALSGQEAAAVYARAAECYERLTHPEFFDEMRFKRFQFVYFRLGCILAEKLDRKADGEKVLWDMADKWKDSPWYGRVIAKIEEITGRTLQPGPYDPDVRIVRPAAADAGRPGQ